MEGKKGRYESKYADGRSASSTAGEKRKSGEHGDGASDTKKKTLEVGTNKSAVPKMKFGIMAGKDKKISVAPIKMSLGIQKKAEPAPLKKPTPTVASVFNEDSDSEEEMPEEARMRMKNVGKFTPTAAGPNSFGKGNMGFVDRRALMKKELDAEWEKTKAEDEAYMKKHNLDIT